LHLGIVIIPIRETEASYYLQGQISTMLFY